MIKQKPPAKGHTANSNHLARTSSSIMDKVKIKRVKRNKKKITTKEKLLAGLGVGSTLLSGIGAVSPQQKPTQIVSTQTPGQGTAGGKVKNILNKLFGVGTAQAAGAADTYTANQYQFYLASCSPMLPGGAGGTSGLGAGIWLASGLPNGLGMNTRTGVISGVPMQSGDFQVQVSVMNPNNPGAAGNERLQFNVHVNPSATVPNSDNPIVVPNNYEQSEQSYNDAYGGDGFGGSDDIGGTSFTETDNEDDTSNPAPTDYPPPDTTISSDDVPDAPDLPGVTNFSTIDPTDTTSLNITNPDGTVTGDLSNNTGVGGYNPDAGQFAPLPTTSNSNPSPTNPTGSTSLNITNPDGTVTGDLSNNTGVGGYNPDAGQFAPLPTTSNSNPSPTNPTGSTSLNITNPDGTVTGDLSNNTGVGGYNPDAGQFAPLPTTSNSNPSPTNPTGSTSLNITNPDGTVTGDLSNNTGVGGYNPDAGQFAPLPTTSNSNPSSATPEGNAILLAAQAMVNDPGTQDNGFSTYLPPDISNASANVPNAPAPGQPALTLPDNQDVTQTPAPLIPAGSSISGNMTLDGQTVPITVVYNSDGTVKILSNGNDITQGILNAAGVAAGVANHITAPAVAAADSTLFTYVSPNPTTGSTNNPASNNAVTNNTLISNALNTNPLLFNPFVPPDPATGIYNNPAPTNTVSNNTLISNTTNTNSPVGQQQGNSVLNEQGIANSADSSLNNTFSDLNPVSAQMLTNRPASANPSQNLAPQTLSILGLEAGVNSNGDITGLSSNYNVTNFTSQNSYAPGTSPVLDATQSGSYTVQPNNTVSEISLLAGRTQDQVAIANGEDMNGNPNAGADLSIAPGQEVTIPAVSFTSNDNGKTFIEQITTSDGTPADGQTYSVNGNSRLVANGTVLTPGTAAIVIAEMADNNIFGVGGVDLSDIVRAYNSKSSPSDPAVDPNIAAQGTDALSNFTFMGPLPAPADSSVSNTAANTVLGQMADGTLVYADGYGGAQIFNSADPTNITTVVKNSSGVYVEDNSSVSTPTVSQIPPMLAANPPTEGDNTFVDSSGNLTAATVFGINNPNTQTVTAPAVNTAPLATTSNDDGSGDELSGSLSSLPGVGGDQEQSPDQSLKSKATTVVADTAGKAAKILSDAVTGIFHSSPSTNSNNQPSPTTQDGQPLTDVSGNGTLFVTTNTDESGEHEIYTKNSTGQLVDKGVTWEQLDTNDASGNIPAKGPNGQTLTSYGNDTYTDSDGNIYTHDSSGKVVATGLTTDLDNPANLVTVTDPGTLSKIGNTLGKLGKSVVPIPVRGQPVSTIQTVDGQQITDVSSNGSVFVTVNPDESGEHEVFSKNSSGQIVDTGITWEQLDTAPAETSGGRSDLKGPNGQTLSPYGNATYTDSKGNVYTTDGNGNAVKTGLTVDLNNPINSVTATGVGTLNTIINTGKNLSPIPVRGPSTNNQTPTTQDGQPLTDVSGNGTLFVTTNTDESGEHEIYTKNSTGQLVDKGVTWEQLDHTDTSGDISNLTGPNGQILTPYGNATYTDSKGNIYTTDSSGKVVATGLTTDLDNPANLVTVTGPGAISTAINVGKSLTPGASGQKVYIQNNIIKPVKDAGGDVITDNQGNLILTIPGQTPTILTPADQKDIYDNASTADKAESKTIANALTIGVMAGGPLGLLGGAGLQKLTGVKADPTFQLSNGGDVLQIDNKNGNLIVYDPATNNSYSVDQSVAQDLGTSSAQGQVPSQVINAWQSLQQQAASNKNAANFASTVQKWANQTEPRGPQVPNP